MSENMGKYRGKTKCGEWVKDSLILSEDGSRAFIGHIRFLEDGMPVASYQEVLPETIGQSTGLKDKRKDQCLYAGDRVVIGGDVGVLVWDEYELCWSLQIESDEFNSICRFYSDEEKENIEYIGNIHS